MLQPCLFSFLNIWCGELQENVTNSTLYDLPEIISIVSSTFESITQKRNDQLLKVPSRKDIELQSPIKDETPPIWGPGLTEPPGGPEYRNRYIDSVFFVLIS